MLGGVLFLIGALIMAYNLWRTARGDVRETVEYAREAGVAAAPANPAHE